MASENISKTFWKLFEIVDRSDIAYHIQMAFLRTGRFIHRFWKWSPLLLVLYIAVGLYQERNAITVSKCEIMGTCQPVDEFQGIIGDIVKKADVK